MNKSAFLRLLQDNRINYRESPNKNLVVIEGNENKPRIKILVDSLAFENKLDGRVGYFRTAPEFLRYWNRQDGNMWRDEKFRTGKEISEVLRLKRISSKKQMKKHSETFKRNYFKESVK